MEHVLMEHSRVRGVGVVGIRLDETTRIAAYVECAGEPGDDALADELRAWCKERLRRYEYPHLVTFVDELPRTLTGKVQRYRLREWAAGRAQAEPASVKAEPPAGLVGSP
jgi:benzoate-CoA ligase